MALILPSHSLIILLPFLLPTLLRHPLIAQGLLCLPKVSFLSLTSLSQVSSLTLQSKFSSSTYFCLLLSCVVSLIVVLR